MDDAELVAFLRAMRACFENNRSRFKMWTLQDFPKGACTWASGIVECALLARGLAPLHKGGRRTENGKDGHEWTVLGGLNLDITGDQFDDCADAVIVSRDSGFHASFKRAVSVAAPRIAAALEKSPELRHDLELVRACMGSAWRGAVPSNVQAP